MLENESAIGLAYAAFSTHSIEQRVQVFGRRDPRSNSEIERAREVKALDNPVILGNEFDEWPAVSPVDEPHIDRSLDRAAESHVIDLGFEAGNHLLFDQPLQAGAGSVRTQANLTPELALSYTASQFHDAEYFSVNLIYHSAYHCTGDRTHLKSGPNSAEFPSRCV